MVNGIGISFATLVPAATAVTRWFRRYRGRAMGIALSASGFAGLGVSPFLDRMLRTAGGNWRVGWEIVAGAMVVAGLIAFLFVKENPESLGQSVDGISEQARNQPSRTRRPRYKTSVDCRAGLPHFRLLADRHRQRLHHVSIFLFVAHWILRLRGAGISSADAALAWGSSPWVRFAAAGSAGC